MPDGPVVAGIVLAAGAVLVGGYFYVEYLRHGRGGTRPTRAQERLPLFGIDALGEGGSPDALRPMPGARPTQPPASRVPRPEFAAPRPATMPSELGSATTPPYPAMPVVAAAPLVQSGFESSYASVAPRTNGVSRQTSSLPMPRYSEGETVRFALPDQGTLQFLPGRLQVVVGPETGREIRFVRSPNSGETAVTFGRSEGPPHRHIQLLVPTVSRRHALMSLVDEHWSLQNLSATNPVTLNGRRLAPDEVVPLLVDGDRIEMGEIVFVFQSR